MQKILLLFLLLLFKTSQAQLNDDFAGDQLNLRWTGDRDAWTINNEGQLQSKKSTTSKTITLKTTNQLALNVQWEFWVKLGFDPSASNQVRIYLVADQENLNAPLNGYFLQIGKAGNSDGYELYRQTGSKNVLIAETKPIVRKNPAQLLTRIKITRDEDGEWMIYSDEEGGNNYTNHISVQDNTHLVTQTFGIWCNYTLTRSDQFFFDDIGIKILKPDTNPPKITQIQALDSLTIQVNFTKPLDETSARNLENYKLKDEQKKDWPIQSINGAGTQWLLYLSQALGSGKYEVQIQNIEDLLGNKADLTLQTFKFIQVKPAKTGDVVINEIYANFNPKVGLPAAKFIEIWNRSPNFISLKNWTYSKKNSSYAFSNDTLGPQEHLILCAKADTGLYIPYGRTLGLSPWPAPNITGDHLILKDAQNQTIFEVNYDDSWYRDALKKKGGWSLELMDASSSCNGAMLWAASIDPRGGTPGNQNSVFKANQGESRLRLLSATADHKNQISLVFNHAVDSVSASLLTGYLVNNGAGTPKFFAFTSEDHDEIVLQFEQPLQEGLLYRINCSSVRDCAGRLIADNGNEVEFMLTAPIQTNDIVINEVLFNPLPQGADFVEIYNRSEKILDLQQLSLATIDEKNDSLKSVKKIISNSYLLKPGEYIVLTTDPENVRTNYYCENPQAFIKMSSMPAFNNEHGVVVLLANNKKIDQFNYNEGMHLKLLKDRKGVSLERVDFNKPANEPGNFQSAATVVGYATPTYKNSQAVSDDTQSEIISLAANTFSPDLDGFQDLLVINYNFKQSGIVASLNIYNDKGHLIKRLLRNQTMAQNGEITWDGLNDLEQLAPVGIYILHTEFFDLSGNVKKHLKTFVLAGKLN